MKHCDNIKNINLGILPMGTFPNVDSTNPHDINNVYIYKRPNGHIYLYKNNNETHICCDDGLITKIPIFLNTNFIHYPDANHVFIYMQDNKLYTYDKDGNINEFNNGGGGGEIDWTIKEW